MKTINYGLNEQKVIKVEVSDDFYSIYVDMQKTEKLLERKETRRHQSLDKSLENGWDICDKNADVVYIVEQKEESLILKKALKELTDRQREILILSAVAGFSFREIGRKLGLNKDTVREHYLTAIKKIKKFFQ